MFEEKLNELYGKIVGQICDMIPVEYEDIYFEGRMSDGGGSVYFFFNTTESEDYIYSLRIPKTFDVNRNVFDKLDDELYELTRELYNTFIEDGQEAWSSVRMHYDKSGQFKLEYSYIDWFEKGYTNTDVINYFKYKYLNIIPSDEEYLDEMKKMESIEND